MKPRSAASPDTTETRVQSPRIERPDQPLRLRPLVAAIASGRLESVTATRNAALTDPPVTIVRPSTIDSGMPSSTIPRTIAGPEPSAWPPPECLRFAPPIRSTSASPAKKTIDPAKRPRATLPVPPPVVNASSTSSKATALIRTPLPKAITIPRARSRT